LPLSLYVLALTFTAVAPLHARISSTQEDLNRMADAFYANPSLDAARVYEVQNAVVKKDIATFTLKSGLLYVAAPAEEITTTALFIGEGNASIQPIGAMDRKCLDLAASEHLHKKLGGKIESPFAELFLVSFDGSLDSLIASARQKSVPDMQKASSLLKERLDIVRNQELGFDLTLLEKKAGFIDGPLYVDFHTPDYGWLLFAYLPDSTREVLAGSRDRIGRFDIVRPLIRTDRIADLSPSGEYIADARRDQKDRIDVIGYKMEITIPDTQHILVEADVTFIPLRENLPFVNFELFNNIAGVKSTDEAKPIYLLKVLDADGKPLPFIHRKNSAYILPPEPLKKGTEYTYHFSLDEQTIIQNSSVHYEVLNTYPWFPQHGYNGGQYTMDWTIKAKKPIVATGSGRIVSETSEGQFNVTHLVLDTPSQFPSLIFGQYQKAEDTYKSINGNTVALSVFSSPVAQFTITDSNVVLALTQGRRKTPITYDLTVPGGKPKSILQEAKDLLKFQEDFYGPYPFHSLQVAQMAPYRNYGQAPPGFIQLTGDAFMSPAAEVKVGEYYLDFTAYKMDFFHEFFGHELSHQWWGHALQWASDEDQWLSESFAEYNAGLYVMALLGQSRFQGKLKEWRDAARMADPHAPIAWANNLSGDNAGIYRTFLLYSKGPYVLHMLRSQMGHEKFITGLRNAIEKYRHQQVTTDEIRREMETVAGYKLDYFFNQWFRDTGIPTFDYSTNVHQADDGKWVATVKISQRDKQNLKIVSMPVFFHFGKDKVVVKERPILKAEDVYQVKLPEKPERITLDDHKTLLADIVSQDPAGQ
jgi:hypothetical protein